MFIHSQVRIQRWNFRNISHDLFRLDGLIFETVYLYLSLIFQKSHNTFYNRAFSCTVRSKQYSDAPILYGKINIIICKHLTVSFCHMYNF